ncbi:MAG TPA: hypothetical protein VFV03_06540 [Solirubrobacteraceae bacterium]|nr:hypothetical protein [Solirubrobacteraceae bacterium]
MDQEVTKTLGELELKLQELERELTSIGRRDTPTAPLDVPEKLIDEAVEGQLDPESPQAEAPPPPPYTPHAPSPPEQQAIDVADLVRFKEKMERTMEELIDEYSRLLSLKPPS